MKSIILFVGLSVCWSSVAAQNSQHLEHRFYMTDNGQKMKATDFDQWMQQRGVRIVPQRGQRIAQVSTGSTSTSTNAQTMPYQPPQAYTPASPPGTIYQGLNTQQLFQNSNSDPRIQSASPGSIVGF